MMCVALKCVVLVVCGFFTCFQAMFLFLGSMHAGIFISVSVAVGLWCCGLCCCVYILVFGVSLTSCGILCGVFRCWSVCDVVMCFLVFRCVCEHVTAMRRVALWRRVYIVTLCSVLRAFAHVCAYLCVIVCERIVWDVVCHCTLRTT